MKRLRFERAANLVILSFVCIVPCLSQTPVSDPAFQEEFAKAKQALGTHKYGDAIAGFKKANKLHQNQCADCYYGMALAFLPTHEIDQALACADKALALTA